MPVDEKEGEDEPEEKEEEEEEDKEPETKEVTKTDWKLVNENKPIWTRSQGCSHLNLSLRNIPHWLGRDFLKLDPLNPPLHGYIWSDLTEIATRFKSKALKKINHIIQSKMQTLFANIILPFQKLAVSLLLLSLASPFLSAFTHYSARVRDKCYKEILLRSSS